MTISEDAMLASLLEVLSAPEGAARLLDDPLFWDEGVCRVLFARCDEVAFEHPREGVELAKIATRLVDRVPAEQCGSEAARALKGRSWAVLGSTLRAVSDFETAETAYACAQQASRWSSPFELGDLSRRLAYLRADQRCLGEALDLAERALSLFRKEASEHAVGCGLVCRGYVQLQAQSYGAARRDFRAAIDLVDPEVGFIHFYAAVHNLAVTFTLDGLTCHSRGELAKAAGLIDLAHYFGRFSAHSLPATKLRGAEGAILLKLGRRGEAESILHAARDGLGRLGATFDLVLVSLELAALYCDQRRYSEVLRVAAEMFPFFGKLRAHREIFAALTLFHRAAVTQRVTRELIHSVKERVYLAASSQGRRA